MGNNIAGIVTYNPDINRLNENICACKKQITDIVIVDNGSNNYYDIISIVNRYNDIEVIRLDKNMGIAYALNEIILYARKNNKKWLLSLDQDSVIYDGLISKYEEIKKKNNNNIAMITCIINDRSIGIEGSKNNADFEMIKQCITSGSYADVDKLVLLNGYDDTMFIDYVDFDICKRIDILGYKIIRVNFIGLLHEVGRACEFKVRGKKRIIYNHDAIRHFYQARNRVYYLRKFWNTLSLKEKYRMLNVHFKKIRDIFHYEDNKKYKFIRYIQGVKEGIKVPLVKGTYNNHENKIS